MKRKLNDDEEKIEQFETDEQENDGAKVVTKTKINKSFILFVLLFVVAVLLVIGLIFIINKKNKEIKNLENELLKVKEKNNLSLQGELSSKSKNKENENGLSIKSVKSPEKIYQIDNLFLKSNGLSLYFNANKENYKLNIFKNDNGLSFYIDQEEHLSAESYSSNFTISQIKNLGKGFAHCDTVDKAIDEIKYIISQKYIEKNGLEISLEKNKEDELKIILSYFKSGTKLDCSITLMKQKKDIDTLNTYLIDYIKKIKEISGIDSIRINLGQSKIIENPKEIDFITDYISSTEKRNINYKLIFQSSRDGDKNTTFHKLVDGISPILILIKERDGGIFGGYTTSTRNETGCLYDNKAFCFNVDDQKIFKIKEDHYALDINPRLLISFGDKKGGVIWLVDGFLNKGFTTCTREQSPYEMKFDYDLTHGKKYFFIKEVEIYQIYLE